MKTHINCMPDPVLLLRDLIQERTGLLIRDGQGVNQMVNRLTPRLGKSGCRSLLEYYKLLSDGGTAAADEWLDVVAELSIVIGILRDRWLMLWCHSGFQKDATSR